MGTGFIYSNILARFSIFSTYFFILSTAVLFFSASLQAHDHPEHDAKPIHIVNARINPTVAGMPVTGAYLTLHNPNQQDIQLLGASSTLSNRVELHEHTITDGLMRMQKVENGITIPAQGKAILEPGGYHIMMMNLTQIVKEGGHYDLTINFSNGSKQTIQLIAKKPSQPSKSHKH